MAKFGDEATKRIECAVVDHLRRLHVFLDGGRSKINSPMFPLSASTLLDLDAQSSQRVLLLLLVPRHPHAQLHSRYGFLIIFPGSGSGSRL